MSLNDITNFLELQLGTTCTSKQPISRGCVVCGCIAPRFEWSYGIRSSISICVALLSNASQILHKCSHIDLLMSILPNVAECWFV